MLDKLDPSVFPILSLNRLSGLLHINKEKILEVAATSGRYYKPFDIIQTRMGKEKRRHIDYPTNDLNFLQRKINSAILRKVSPSLPDGLIGGVTGKSIVTNAIPHINQEMVVTIDLRDCFPNTTNKKVYKVWTEVLGCGRDVARVLTQLTTFQTRTPQGVPTSLMISNLALLPIYEEILILARNSGLAFTLYVDDITISGKAGPTLTAIGPVLKTIQKNGRAIRNDKIIIMPSNIKQKVTGVVVNKKVAANLQKVQEVREEILKLSKKSKVSVSDIRSVKGKIQDIKNLSPSRGHNLEELAEVLLPTLQIFEGSKVREERVPCKSTKKHRHYKI